MGKRINIAVYLPQIYTEYMVHLRKGIEEEARKRGFRLIFFTSLVDNTTFGNSGKENKNYNDGERSIFYLADFDRVDAVILLYDSFAKTHWDELFDIVQNRCKCPVVNFRTPLEGAYNILVDDQVSFANMVQHFITVHHATKINIVTGPKDNIHSLMRLDIYKEVLDRNQITYDEERVFYGNFWRNCGMDAVNAFMNASADMPEAIACANDYMAISVIQALEEMSYHVPENIMVSGYDNMEEGLFHKPALTTVQQPVVSMGKMSVEIVDKVLSGEKLEKEIYLPSEVVCRQSCGCVRDSKEYEVPYSSILSERLDEMAALETTATTMITFMANAPNFDSCMKYIEEYALLDTGFDDFALCLAENWEQQLPAMKSIKNRGSQILNMVVGIFDGKPLEPCSFSINELVPDIFMEHWEKTYYIFPLHYLQYYFGFAIVSIKHNVPNGSCIKAWFQHLASALENIRIKGRLESVVSELEDLYVKDTLTGLYNRRGFDKIGDEYYEHCLKNKSNLLMVEIDMDGLKQINDEYGHMDGDIGLITIAQAMLYAAKGDEVCIRSGGDEYVLIGRDYTKEKLDALLSVFKEYIELANEKNVKPYRFGASVGYYMAVPDGTESVEDFLKKADMAMYENKKQRKAASSKK